MESKDYILADVSPNILSENVLEPLSLPRPTQTSVGKYLVPKQQVSKGTSEFKCRSNYIEGTGPAVSDLRVQQTTQNVSRVCRCDSVSPPWWHAPPFWWKSDLSNPASPVGDINDYAIVGEPEEHAKPADMLNILQIERPERYIPGQIYRIGLEGIGDKCLEQHRVAQEMTLSNMGICPSQDKKIPNCDCTDSIPNPEQKFPIEHLAKKSKSRIPYCSESEKEMRLLSDKPCCICVNKKSVYGREKHSCCPGLTNVIDSDKTEPITTTHVSDCPNIKEEIAANDSPVDDDESRPWIIKSEYGPDSKPVCLCPDKKQIVVTTTGHEINHKDINKCGSAGESVRPCNVEPYLMFTGLSSQSCRDQLREEELSKVGYPFKTDTCRWYNTLFPPLRTMSIGKSPRKIFPHMKYTNL